ncbi:MAG: peptidoglycan editing factor PgeF [Deltaproteobacteria bacterium]|nr:peptidoglycan editing factor PgeF [Deltaproteobacteria bacterium]MBF0526472.1 peptidoglycan editing factor PgeF [Deltaproteobacteria bacterium]
MIKTAHKGLTYYTFPKLNAFDAVKHGAFTRSGGVSPPPYGSLNLSISTGDHPENVAVNLTLIREMMTARLIVSGHQEHGSRVAVIRQADNPDQQLGHLDTGTCDALVTNSPGLALLVKQADCQAVLLYDPVNRVVANVHSGWRGSVAGVVPKTVAVMVTEFGSSTQDLVAGIAPSLGPCCAEFKNYHKELPEFFLSFMDRPNYFDFWAITRRQLIQAGLSDINIETSGLCTRCRTDLFFSYRGEGVTGRFGSAIMLRDDHFSRP